MLKWIIIFCAVALFFSAVLLGLGFLLNENEKQTTAYLNQQEALQKQALKKQVTSELLNSKKNASRNLSAKESKANNEENVSESSIILPIIANNLTCVSDDQCVIVEAEFADLICHVAINRIGQSLLKNSPKEMSKIKQCLQQKLDSRATCRNNLCTLE